MDHFLPGSPFQGFTYLSVHYNWVGAVGVNSNFSGQLPTGLPTHVHFPGTFLQSYVNMGTPAGYSPEDRLNLAIDFSNRTRVVLRPNPQHVFTRIDGGKNLILPGLYLPGPNWKFDLAGITFVYYRNEHVGDERLVTVLIDENRTDLIKGKHAFVFRTNLTEQLFAYLLLAIKSSVEDNAKYVESIQEQAS